MSREVDEGFDWMRGEWVEGLDWMRTAWLFGKLMLEKVQVGRFCMIDTRAWRLKSNE